VISLYPLLSSWGNLGAFVGTRLMYLFGLRVSREFPVTRILCAFGVFPIYHNSVRSPLCYQDNSFVHLSCSSRPLNFVRPSSVWLPVFTGVFITSPQRNSSYWLARPRPLSFFSKTDEQPDGARHSLPPRPVLPFNAHTSL